MSTGSLRSRVLRAVVALSLAAAAGLAAAADARTLGALLDGVLAAAVEDGYVDYPAIARNVRFHKYLEGVASFDPATLTGDDERKAFWINAYNAFAIKNAVDGITPVTMTGRIKFFRTTEHTVGGRALDLNTIENEFIAPFEDPRLHFALVPAAYFAPKLPAEAYRAEDLEQQLERNLRDFVADKRKNRFLGVNYTAKLSRFFEFHAKQFDDDEDRILEFVSHYVADEELAESLAGGDFSIEYGDADWSINGRGMN